jgi:S-methylmethionine-dependent homocysteine/selenocysteine methylase
MESTLVFHLGMELPHFASFDILSDSRGADILKSYFKDYLEIAKKHKMGFILESPTWRASKDWGYLMGYDAESLANINKSSIELLEQLREKYEEANCPIVISGCIGPRGDGYAVDSMMTSDEAKAYHAEQIKTFSETNVDLVTTFTINYTGEALGVTQAAKDAGLPVVIGFTLETDGNLPSGESLADAIREIDRITGEYPSYYMINCAHPTHFKDTVKGEGKWKERIMAIRANASKKSHAELDESEHLDTGDACELANNYVELRELLPNLKVIGGCCGTDHTHIEEICRHWNQVLVH